MAAETSANNANAGGAAPQQPRQHIRGIVKQVLDGGAVVIRGQPRAGPPPERTLALAEIDAPRLARRPTPTQPNPTPAQDEPLAWESREFLRKMLVGKAIIGVIHHKVPSGREYGSILLGNDPETAENVTVSLLTEGLAKCRDNCQDEALKTAEAAAKLNAKGLWAPDASSHVREVIWEVDDPRQLKEKFGNKRIPAIIENVRDGSTLRAFLLPDFYHVTLMLSGVRSPTFKLGAEGKPEEYGADPFALEAHYFTESRMLQQEVEIVLESVNNRNFVGSVFHPNGNIAEALLKQGFAKCVDWSLACATEGPEKYRKAQAYAKEQKLKLWHEYTGPSGPAINAKDKQFTGKVVEVVNGDALVVKRSKTEVRKVHLASIRPPRLEEGAERGKTFRALYDIPYMFEAREFLRKKLIGHNVQVIVDYIQPANNDFPEKTCCTIMIGEVNVAEALVSRGLATVVRYAADNDQRSSRYDELLTAEDKAKKSNKGLHCKKDNTARRIADVSGDVAKSKQFLPFLKRQERMQAVVEFVASASRYRLYIPRETCVITFLLSGIQCPRGERVMPGGTVVEAEPFGNEAAAYVKEMILQREVEIVVENIDKGGNFIGWCFEGPSNANNISLSLVEEGFAKAFIMGDRSSYGANLLAAEEAAKKKKLRRWANYVEEEDTSKDDDKENGSAAAAEKEIEGERKVNYVKAVVTEVTNEAKLYMQHVDDGSKLEELMGQIRKEFTENPPLSGAYNPKKGDMCAAKFVDGQWYRAKVEKVTMSTGSVSVLYVDYGNRADIPKGQTASLPASFNALQPFAHEYSLALCQLAQDEEYASLGLDALKEDLLDKQVKLNVEYKLGTVSYVSVVDAKSEDDIGKGLIAEGLLMAEKRGGRRVAKLVDSYLDAMKEAKRKHLNIWRYGDITEDDAREFGAGR